MNEFKLYEQLCTLENIVERYYYSGECKNRILNLENNISTRLYRVAVIGEFKRGKSSLINALLGTKILPTDILPMTASVTRVKYGVDEKIVVYYKSGTQEEKTVDELINYATKYDAEKELTSEQIKEVEVYYPSVLCKNNIEILDTPGMNDNEKMTEITLGVLSDVDAAIMVISAMSPLSITEQNLIIQMIKKRDIRHIVFVVSHIDAISEVPSEQDKIIEKIKERISVNLLLRAESEFQDDEFLITKSKKILEFPNIFGVSSVLAMKGFVSDDNKTLKLSRLPDFKQELLNLLTAAQSVDIKDKVIDITDEVESSLESWYKFEHDELCSEKESLYALKLDYEKYFEQSKKILIGFLSKMDNNVDDIGLFEERSSVLIDLYNQLKLIFIKNLSQIKESTNTNENIRRVLEASFETANEKVNEFNISVENKIQNEFRDLYNSYKKLRPIYEKNLSECFFSLLLILKVGHKWRETEFPKLALDCNVFSMTDLKEINPIDIIKSTLKNSLKDYCKKVENYLASWRVLYLQHHNLLLSNNTVLSDISNRISKIDLRLNAMQFNIGDDLIKIQKSKSLFNK